MSSPSYRKVQPFEVDEESATGEVTVVAPSDMPGGFQFACEVEGKKYTVEVPKGGVRSGESFRARVTTKRGDEDADPHNIPHGNWRDGLCDCFNHLPTCCFAFCFQACALGQVLSRMKLDSCGNPTTPERSSMSPFKVFWNLTAVLLVAAFFKGYGDGMVAQTNTIPAWYPITVFAYTIMTYILAVWTIIATRNAYMHIKNKYSIDKDNHSSYSLCLTAIFCRPCATAQMLRHTADYLKYPSSCCVETGLQPHAPQVV